MKNQYELIMDRIEITEDMQERILTNLHDIDLCRVPSAFPHAGYKKYLAISACLAVLTVGTISVPGLLKFPSRQLPSQPQTGAPPLMTAPVVTEYSSAEELSEAIGFKVKEAVFLPFQAEMKTYLSRSRQLAEITYSGEGQTAVFRQAAASAGASGGDISGDYNAYDTTIIVTAGARNVTLKGNDGLMSLAVWEESDRFCSLKLSRGVEKETWDKILSEIS